MKSLMEIRDDPEQALVAANAMRSFAGRSGILPNDHLLPTGEVWQAIEQHVDQFSPRNMRATHTIEMCGKCDGAGLQREEECVDYHRRDYDSWTITCTECGGSGRFAVVTYVNRQPYVQNAPDR